MAPGRYTGTMPETQTQLLPLLPLTQGVVFPQMVVTIALETDESKRAGTAAGEAGNRLVLVPRIDGRFATVGTVAAIESAGDLPNGTRALVIRGVSRARIGSGETGAHGAAATNQAGQWPVFGVPSGSVKVRVDSTGFKSWEQSFAYDANHPGPVITTLTLGVGAETITVDGETREVPLSGRNYSDLSTLEKESKKQAQAVQSAPSSNVVNLQRRVAGVLPVAIDVPRAGTAFHFVRPLVAYEETKVTFTYRSK